VANTKLQRHKVVAMEGDARQNLNLKFKRSKW
jgi:hypothetical protein